MRLIDRRSRVQRLVEDTGTGVKSALENVPSSKAAKAGLAAAAGIAGLTAVSARISSRRHGGEDETDDS
jgi:hypothetical protein